MLLFYFIFGLTSLEFILNDQNIEELANISMITPVFILFRSPYCPHCQKVAPIWQLLAIKYNGVNGIVVADVDCIASPKACKYFMDVHSYPTFAIISKNISSKTMVDRSLEAWTSLVEKIISFGANYRCNIWLEQTDKYPLFVLTTPKGSEETCDDILEIIKQVPKSKGLIYANPNGTEYSCQVNMNAERSYIYSNQTNSTVFIPFIKEFLFHPFGDWDISEAIESDRRIAFFIYDDKRSLKRFNDIIFNQSTEYVFGGIKYENFNDMYPKIELEKSELPALGISNYQHSRFLLMTNVKPNDELYIKLSQIASGEEKNMTFKMDKIMKLRQSILEGKPIYADPHTYLTIGIVILVIFLIWKLFFNHTQKIGKEIRHRNMALSKAFHELKLLFHDKCSNKGQKTPTSLL
ncbi:hypothetical protein M9Y10_017383 [Tritrichomonas musculus]|uniref:Thioredoxin domain-containing protein n=1 Tax=Tritrichomonas musculus TaxID=1915356 RepID=A0ABR2HU95_9EUKA